MSRADICYHIVRFPGIGLGREGTMPMRQITVWGRNRPGNLAKIASALAEARINVSGLFASDTHGKSPVRLLVRNAARARAALRWAGLRSSEEPHIVVAMRDRPGQIARISKKLARSRVNINYAYATVSPGARRANIVLGVSNAAAARRALR